METKVNDSTFLPVGTELSLQYKIIGHIGAGGFGKTYLIEDQLGNKKVMKEFFISSMCTRNAATNTVTISVDENRATFKEQLETFKREARRINALSHPNIVKVSGLFEDNGTAYYVMDYIDGETLAQKYKREKLTEPQIMRYLNQLLDALEYIHSQKLTHLDIKPGNIMIDKNDNVVLIDFGASKLFNAQSVNKTMMSSMRPPFTLGYAPAEQENGNVKDMGPHCDIYAVGATLYTLFMGEKPAVPFEILQNNLPAVTNASPQMQEVIKQSMAYMAKDRIKTVAEFRKALGGEFTMKDVTIKEQPDPKTKIIQPPKSETDTNVTHKEVVAKAPKHVDWIDVKQFLYQNKRINTINTIVNNKYFLYLKSLLVAARVILLVIILLQIFFTFTEGWEEYALFRVLARILDEMEIRYWHDDLDGFAFIVLWIIFGLVSIVLRCLKTTLNSSVLNKIYAIEQSDNEGDQVLRTRSQKGKIGLCKKRKYSVKELLLTEYDEINKVAVDTFVCVKRGKLGLYKCTNFEAKEHLPMEYDAIYPCDKEVYICEQKGKKGVYNVELKKMMIPLEYDAIEVVPGNQLVAYKNGVPTKYTSKGFRVV